MIALLTAWISLAVVTLPVGLTLLWLAGDRMLDGADRIVIALWLGLLGQALMLEILALSAPLWPWGIALVPALALATGILRRSEIRELAPAGHAPGRAHWIALGLLAMALAYVASGRLIYFDSMLYHIQIARWLADYGLVPGLALLHERFGSISPWFAMVAMFDADWLHGRMLAAADGYAVLMLTIHALVAGTRILKGRSRPGDWLLAAGLLLLICHSLWLGTSVSASPDLPTAALTLMCGWIMAKAWELENVNRLRNADACPTALLLGAMAIALKISALPVFAISSLFCAWCARGNPLGLSRPLALAGLCLVPNCLASIVSSGCPAFPESFGCRDLPWTLTPAQLQAIRSGIAAFARWYGPTPAGARDWDWVLPWLLHPRNQLNPPLFALALVSVAFVAAIFARDSQLRRSTMSWAFLLGLVGTLFVLISAPDSRFAIGSIALLFGVATELAIQCLTIKVTWNWTFRAWPSNNACQLCLSGLIAFAIILFGTLGINSLNRKRWNAEPIAPWVNVTIDVPITDRLIVPPTLPVVWGVTRNKNGRLLTMARKNSADLIYFVPTETECWNAAPPCTPGPVAPIRLRRPKLGLAGGFVRAKP